MALGLRVYTNTSAMAELEERWRAFQWNPYCDFDFFLHQYGRRAKEEAPFVISVTDDGGVPVSIVAGTIQARPIQFQIGYKSWHGPPLKTLVIHHHGILGRDDQATWAVLETHLEVLLVSRAFDALLLSNLSLASPAHRLRFRQIPSPCHDPCKIVQEHWQLSCSSRFEDFIRSHKRFWGGTYKKCENRIKKRSGNDFNLKCFVAPEDLDLILEHTEQIARKTWQRSLGAQTFLNRQVKERYHFLLGKGWLRAYLLYVCGEPVAFLHGVLYNRVFYSETTGYDPAYRHEGVGSYLLVKVIEAYSGRDDTRFFDFSVGNSQAKSLFCDISFKAADRYLVAPTARLKALNLARTAVLATHLFAKRLLTASGHYGSIRAAWRYGR